MKNVIFILILLSFGVFAYDNVIEYDMNNNIIFSTTVYDSDGKPCIDCVCNFTLFNTTPYENFIYLNTQLDNKGSGIYSKNLSSIKTIKYSENIYPLNLVCVNSAGISSGDDRDGIKVSETTFDFTSGILAFVGVAIALVIMAFWVDDRFKSIKLVSFFSSFIFMALALVLGYAIMLQSPQPTNFKIIFGSGIIAFLMVILAVIYFYVYERFEDLAENLFGKHG